MQFELVVEWLGLVELSQLVAELEVELFVFAIVPPIYLLD